VITCRLLGPVQVTVDGQPAQPELLWRKNVALLVYLARSPRLSRTRDHLTGLLWGEKPEVAARHSLREAVRVLRRSLGEDIIRSEGDQIRLTPDGLTLDTNAFDEAERAAQWEAAAGLVAGDFLEGFGVPDASAFEDWLTAERHNWRRRAARALTEWAKQNLAEGQAQQASDTALRAIQLEPASEEAARTAMKALVLAGDRAGALTCYDELVSRLRDAGVELGAETSALGERVRRERKWRLSDEVPQQADRGAETRRAPLIGREGELAQVLEAVKCAEADRRSAVCMIIADSGLGRSRLLEEITTRARLDGMLVAAVRAVEADVSAAWSGVLGLARSGLLDGRGLAAASPEALAALAAELPEWADRFGAPNRPAPLGAAFTQVIRALGEEQPVLLAIDDAQWLDRESLLELSAVLRDLSMLPVVVAVTSRREPSRAEVDELRSRVGRDLSGTSIHLQPLDDHALRTLVQWAVPSFDAAEIDRLTRRVAADSAGLPLLAVELLHAVALGMDLGRIVGAWPEPYKTLDQTLPTDLPDAVIAAVRVGFRRLSDDAQQLLAVASILGERVSRERLEHCSGIGGETLLDALDELEWQRWLVCEPRGYSFLARVVQEVVARDMLTEGQRQRILERGGGS
jgi:DNA-binding SARP family transcriptional activator